MSNIRKLEIIKKHNSTAIEYLEEVLAQAKSGEVTEVVIIAKLANGEYENCWTGCDDLHQLVGQLERLKFLTLRRMDVI